MSSSDWPDVWLRADLADGQCALVERELEAGPQVVAPYAAFLRALDRIVAERGTDRLRLLDVGCGVGHYGSLLRRYRPHYGIAYQGTDYSAAMIAQARAREPGLAFQAREYADNDFSAADVVLLSQVAEVSAQPIGNLLLGWRRARGHVIWHRVRVVERSGWIVEPTYHGHDGPIWLWSLTDATALLDLSGRRYRIDVWPTVPNVLTVTLQPASRE